jgi:small subunit ribosomal protein S5
MTRVAGIVDLSASVPRSRNKMNVCKATLQALLSQKDPEEVARARGRKFVDLRKVYYGGLNL